MTKFHLEAEVIRTDERSSISCDGCEKEIAVGEVVITGITSCCGGGCFRALCKECILRAVSLGSPLDITKKGWATRLAKVLFPQESALGFATRQHVEAVLAADEGLRAMVKLIREGPCDCLTDGLRAHKDCCYAMQCKKALRLFTGEGTSYVSCAE